MNFDGRPRRRHGQGRGCMERGVAWGDVDHAGRLTDGFGGGAWMGSVTFG